MARRMRTELAQAPGPDLFAPSAGPSVSLAALSAVVPDERVESPTRLESRRDPYSRFYSALAVLREDFHRIGHFDDANAKLDELCKLLVLKVLDARHPLEDGRSRLCSVYLADLAEKAHGDRRHIAAAMHDVFTELADKFPDEIEALGPNRGLNIRADDDEFARALIPTLEALPRADLANGGHWSFDGLNEAFGHFIQDSFRNRKEDAQYMTPPEVVSALVQIAFADIVCELGGQAPASPLLIADPTCGVGSFLGAAYRHALHVALPHGCLADHLTMFGQDKVDRMVRLANVNLTIFAGVRATIRTGNSILPPSGLRDIQGKVDLVITNPPFGATFESDELMREATAAELPTLVSLARSRSLPKTVDSEYLLLDRELALLKPGGRLLMVVPDHVVSGSGFSETFRLALLRHADLVAVFDLPTEAFAQAGTRTKTSVVYLRRRNTSHSDAPSGHVFMATSEDLGFRVVSRVGASVKRIVGHNDMDRIVEIYKTFRASAPPSSAITCLSKSPSVAAVAPDHLLNNRWTAGFYQTERLSALQDIELAAGRGFVTRPLTELASLDPDSAERVFSDGTNRCISVLHVREDGCIDLQAVQGYRPTTACARCRPGDVLLSKINPRIMRVCVVPTLPWGIGCSSEFAVLRMRKAGLSEWAMLLLLRSEIVQAQIRTLTSGTSSSHNRIKDRDLAAIRVPVPKPDSDAARELEEVAHELRESTCAHYRAIESMLNCFGRVQALLIPKT